MSLPEVVVVPNYGTPETYQAFVELMSPEAKAIAKPWEEVKANSDALIESGEFNGKRLVSVAVTPNEWKSWCDSLSMARDHNSVFEYAVSIAPYVE
ncbi:MAG: hypothetical protein EOP84_03435 [Verrucomicrobiaceae bacterium]|nr:MAG: hypothetical protein EOP84_03435 [Verrucomicrobiaceae bacterium]